MMAVLRTRNALEMEIHNYFQVLFFLEDKHYEIVVKVMFTAQWTSFSFNNFFSKVLTLAKSSHLSNTGVLTFFLSLPTSAI